MSIALNMVLAAEGLFLSAPPGQVVMSRADCVSSCYRDRACLSAFYRTSTRQCYLMDATYDQADMNLTIADMQYLVWESNGCKDGYTINSTLNLCYKLYRDWKNWNQAEGQCVQDGGHLISATTDDVINFVNSVSTYRLWMGGRLIDNQWKWLDNTPINTDMWYYGIPDYDDKSCVMIFRSGELNNNYCTYTYRFVCQTLTVAVRTC